MYTRALVKTPSSRFSEGITSQRLGAPDQSMVERQHQIYCEALCAAGLELTTLAVDEHPDSCFVEDLALVSQDFVVRTRPGHSARAAEASPVHEALSEIFPAVPRFAIDAPGTLEGGDVLRMGSNWYVGLSSRTNGHGIAQLREILSAFNQSCHAVDFDGLLHLKTGVSRLGSDTVIAVTGLAEQFRDFGYQVVEVNESEGHAANVVSLGSQVILPAGYPRLCEVISALGICPVSVPLSEFAKQDGGATCLSILIP